LQLAAHNSNPIWPDRRGIERREVDEPGRRIEHTVGGRNLETPALPVGTLWTAVFDPMIAALHAPANQAQGLPLGRELPATKWRDLCAPRA
jgi:hypothetical protein